eukprot:scaffold72085_cov62-Phaeocystis_antarctica.AAC.2
MRWLLDQHAACTCLRPGAFLPVGAAVGQHRVRDRCRRPDQPRHLDEPFGAHAVHELKVSKRGLSRPAAEITVLPAPFYSSISYNARWILGKRPDHRFEFLERYGSCRVVTRGRYYGTTSVPCEQQP